MKRFLTLMVGFCLITSAFGQNNDFLTDYSKLEKTDGRLMERVFIAPNGVQRLADYNAVLVDQPEIFIASESKYKGAKGDQLKALADVARRATIARLDANGYTIATEPGPDVLYMRWAITELFLQKKKRGILSYTPLGMVVHATQSAAVRDLWKKIDIAELAIEIEFSDFVTGEVLAAGVSRRQGFRKVKGNKADLVSWQEMDALFSTVGERISCQLSNTETSEENWTDCTLVWIEPEVPAKK